MERKRFFVLAALPILLLACGGEEMIGDDVELEEVEEGVLSMDTPVGELFIDEAPPAIEDLCLDEEDCEQVEVESVAADAEVAAEDARMTESIEAEVIASATAGPVAGSRMLASTYAAFRRSPSSSAARLNVDPHGGVSDDALHPSRSPRGYITPGQTVVLVEAGETNGYAKVRYDGVTGWVLRRKLIWRDPSVSRLTLAKRSGVRNTFFKHQILRSKWNKDGPTSSGNCAPASLAMAALVFGREPSGLSVEKSIHRVRAKYDSSLHEHNGTTLRQVALAADRLNLNFHTMGTDVSPSAGLRRLNGQLSRGRAVVLFGLPGKPGAGPTLYEQAFTRAYRAAIERGERLRHSSYNYNGGHAIVVLGRDGDGRYIVGDPISEVGFLAINATAMKDFITRFSGNRGVGVAVWR